MNIAGDQASLDALTELGARTVPVVSRGSEWTHAIKKSSIVEFLGLDENTDPVLDPQTLVDRLDQVLAGSQRFVAQFSNEQLDLKLTNRDRSYRVIAHHIFQIPVAFLEVAENDEFLSHEMTVKEPGPDQQTPEQIVAFGQTVRDRLAAYRPGLDEAQANREVKTYWADQSLHELLERTTWHSGQHARQLMSLLEQLGTAPQGPLGDETFADLPIPQKVWDD